MSYREKLERIVADYSFSPRTASVEILAAGFRKQRAIITAEELHELPVGSVVLSEKYTVHGEEGFLEVAFQRWADGLWHRGGMSGDTHPDNFLPVTVIHEPL